MPMRERVPLVRRPVGERGERAKEAALAILRVSAHDERKKEPRMHTDGHG